LTVAAGHLHDGGTTVEFIHNNKTICNSNAEYGAIASNTVTAHGGHGTGNQKDMISSMTICEPLAPLKKGDTLSVTASFDAIAHPMREGVEGNKDEVMALGLVYIAVPIGQ
jgi:hypothetical protein